MLPLTNQIGDVLCDGGGGGQRPCNFIKKETLAQVFPYGFCKISKNTFSYRPKFCSFIKKVTLTKVFSCKPCESSNNTFSTEQLRTTASVFRLFYL